MSEGYFERVHAQTDSRFWINLPTNDEITWALEAGAVNCTTNPTYCARLIDLEPEYMRGLIDQAVRESESDDTAAELVYRRSSGRIIDRFLPMFKQSGGKQGYVTVQGNTNYDEDADYVINEALRHTELGPSMMAKIPINEAGLHVIEELTARNIPTCATEIFGVDQAIEVCQAYQRGAKRGNCQPAFFVTHITGIFDRYMREYVEKEKIDIDPAVLDQAGWAVAHEEYRVLNERGLPGIMLGGGAIKNSDFTQMVGGTMHVTLNWSIIKSLLDENPPVVDRISQPAPAEVVEELSAKLPAFKEAYYEGGLKPAQYKDHGPLILFRSMFLNGYNKLLAEVKARRQALS